MVKWKDAIMWDNKRIYIKYQNKEYKNKYIKIKGIKIKSFKIDSSKLKTHIITIRTME